jgi:hypothetical protein
MKKFPYEIRSISSVFLICLNCALSSCSFFLGGDVVPKKDSKYTYQIDSTYWKPTDPETSDHAYSAPDSSAHIIINSACVAKIADRPLDSLSKNILTGFTSWELTNEQTISFLGQEAREIAGKGKSDQVKYQFDILTFKRNQCIYDLVYIGANPNKYQEELSSFKQFLSTFRLK